MVKVVSATYDGQVFRPDELIELKPNTRVKITVETNDGPAQTGKSFLRTARSLELQGPADWSSNLEEYLYPSRDSE